MAQELLEQRQQQPKDFGIPPQLQKYIPFVEQSINANKQLYFTLLHDTSVDFIPGVGFSSDLKTGVVRLGVEDYPTAERLGVIGTPEFEAMQVYSSCHELGHMRDLKENPKVMLGNLEYLEERAKQLSPQALEIIGRKIGGQVPEYLIRQIPVDREGIKTMSAMEFFLYNQLFSLYNKIDDIYINRDIPNHAARFAGSAREASNMLYRDFLFPTNPANPGISPRELEAADYEAMPKSAQLINYLLRKTMVPDQEILISPEVRETLSGYMDAAAQFLGLTLEKEVQNLTSPANSKAKDPGWRYPRIRQTVEKVFTEFLLRDLEEQTPPTEDEMKKLMTQIQGQEGEPSEENGEPNNSPWSALPTHHSGPIKIEDLKEFIKAQDEKAKAEEAKEKEEERKQRLTPGERAQAAQTEADKQICEEFNIDPKLAQEYRELARSVDPYKKDIAQVFETIMQTIQQRITTFWAEGFTSGKFNVERFIRKYGPDIAAQRPDLIPWEILDSFDQKDVLSRLMLWPDRLKVRLVLDGSGSTARDNRILSEKQLAVLFLEGLSTYETTMNLRFRLKNPLVVDTEIWMYGKNGKALLIKPINSDKPNYRAELAARFTATGKIHPGYGESTCDGEPLWEIANSISSDYEADLKSGKAKDILFEVTDGGTNEVSTKGASLVVNFPLEENMEYKGKTIIIQKQAAQDSRNALEVIKSKGVIAKAFQIGEPAPVEQATFDLIWGNDGSHTPHPQDVAPSAGKMLGEEMLKTRFFIEYYEEEEE